MMIVMMDDNDGDDDNDDDDDDDNENENENGKDNNANNHFLFRTPLETSSIASRLPVLTLSELNSLVRFLKIKSTFMFSINIKFIKLAAVKKSQFCSTSSNNCTDYTQCN